jgi:hypothetical protein
VPLEAAIESGACRQRTSLASRAEKSVSLSHSRARRLYTAIMGKDPLETAKQLVKIVVRMFYETEHIVLIDALCYHGALHVSDMVQILDQGKNSKYVGKLIGRLKEAGLCTTYVESGEVKLTVQR